MEQVIISKSKGKAEKFDEDYELTVVKQDNQMAEAFYIKKCALCHRIDAPIVGPFSNVSEKKKNSSELLYFHKECLEVNNHSEYSSIKQKWVNIGKAIEANDLFKKKKIVCNRCSGEGPTIKC